MQGNLEGYVKVDANKPAAYIKVYGFILLDAQGNYGWANCTEGVTSVTARPGVASSIHTQVYENRGTQTYVRTMLKGRSAHAAIGTLGVWSPDSTRTYTFLN